MPVKLNLGPHETAKHAEERFVDHFKTADAFIFEATPEEPSEEVVKDFLEGKIDKKKWADNTERMFQDDLDKYDAFILGKGELPSHCTEHNRRTYELLREENKRRIVEGRRPIIHYWEPFDRLVFQKILDAGIARFNAMQKLRNKDFEGLKEASLNYYKKEAEMHAAREYKIVKLAKPIESRKKIHLGIGIGWMHLPIVERLKSEGVEMLEPIITGPKIKDPFHELERLGKLDSFLAVQRFLIEAKGMTQDVPLEKISEKLKELNSELTEEKMREIVVKK